MRCSTGLPWYVAWPRVTIGARALGSAAGVPISKKETSDMLNRSAYRRMDATTSSTTTPKCIPGTLASGTGGTLAGLVTSSVKSQVSSITTRFIQSSDRGTTTMSWKPPSARRVSKKCHSTTSSMTADWLISMPFEASRAASPVNASRDVIVVHRLCTP